MTVPRFVDQRSAMGRKVAEHDWSVTPLGSIESWPAALKIAVGLVLRSGFPKCLCWGPDLIAIYNDGFVQILGDKGDCLGRSFKDIWAEAWHEIGPIADRALGGDATYIQDFPLDVDRGHGPERAFFTFSYSPIIDEDGVVRGLMDTVVETTGRVERERLDEIKNRELQHRMKNSYSLIGAIAGQTFRTSKDPAEIQSKLLGRVRALSQAQDILSRGRDGGGLFGDVILSSLAPLVPDLQNVVSIEGPDADLTDPQAFSLALAIHELATNSLKYGALSTPTGKLHITWSTAEGLHLHWVESGGPLVTPPSKQGFGTFLFTDALANAFDGTVTVDYAPTGFALTLIGRPPSSA